MRIIGKNKKAIKTRKRTCTKCGSVIEFQDHEVKEYHGTDYGGGPDGQKWMVCPNKKCKNEIVLESW